MTTTEILYEDLEKTDVITVEVIPELKGLILKHCEYYVSSRRHGTTVTRRYSDFVQLHEVLTAKYPYRAISRLPPKRVHVNGGGAAFVRRRRAALRRWLTLLARHPLLAHDADLRAFLCEPAARLERPRHDEFALAGAPDLAASGACAAQSEAESEREHEALRLLQLGLDRIFEVIERVEERSECERDDMRALGAALTGLAAPAPSDAPRWRAVREALRVGGLLASRLPGAPARGDPDDELDDDGCKERLLLGSEALGGYRALQARLRRGLHGERAAAARRGGGAGLRARLHFATACQLEEARVARAYVLAALQSLPAVLGARARAAARGAGLWADLHAALAAPA